MLRRYLIYAACFGAIHVLALILTVPLVAVLVAVADPEALSPWVMVFYLSLSAALGGALLFFIDRMRPGEDW